MGLGVIPKSVLGLVFGFLDKSEVACSRAVCRQWQGTRACWTNLPADWLECCEPLQVRQLQIVFGAHFSRVVQALGNLERVHVAVRAADLVALASCPLQTGIDTSLTVSHVTDLAPLSQMQVTSLHLRGPNIDGACLGRASQSLNLSCLRVSFLSPSVTASDMACLSLLTRLQRLDLQAATGLRHSWFQHLEALTCLHHLDLSFSRHALGMQGITRLSQAASTSDVALTEDRLWQDTSARLLWLPLSRDAQCGRVSGSTR